MKEMVFEKLENDRVLCWNTPSNSWITASVLQECYYNLKRGERTRKKKVLILIWKKKRNKKSWHWHLNFQTGEWKAYFPLTAPDLYLIQNYYSCHFKFQGNWQSGVANAESEQDYHTKANTICVRLKIEAILFWGLDPLILSLFGIYNAR